MRLLWTMIHRADVIVQRLTPKVSLRASESAVDPEKVWIFPTDLVQTFGAHFRKVRKKRESPRRDIRGIQIDRTKLSELSRYGR